MTFLDNYNFSFPILIMLEVYYLNQKRNETTSFKKYKEFVIWNKIL